MNAKHRHTTRGYVMAVISAVAYGLNPLFGRPLTDMGMSVPSLLFYRYTLAGVLLAVLMKARGENFRLSRYELPAALVAGVLFALSSVCLFQSFTLMDVGIASTILFVYPVFVTIIMVAMFREKVSVLTIVAIALATVGVAFLSLSEGGGSGNVSLGGILCVLGSAVSFAIYIVAVNKSRLRRLSVLKLTFYSMVFGMIVIAAFLKGFTSLEWVPAQPLAWGCIVGLAVFPTIISLVTMTVAVHDVGSIPTSILGALEPMTALVVGVTVFGERLSGMSVMGVVLVIGAVVMIVVSEPLLNTMRQLLIRVRFAIRRR